MIFSHFILFHFQSLSDDIQRSYADSDADADADADAD
jgi:hypothetical protein